MAEQGDILKAHCNVCSGERKHHLVHYYETKWEEQIGDDPRQCMHGDDKYELLQCAGCDSIKLRHTSRHSEEMDNEGHILPKITYYPPSTFRRMPGWVYGVTFSEELSISWPPDFVPRLLEEIYTALHANCRGIAAMGVRALVEAVMLDSVGDHGSFTQNLEEFRNKGFIGDHQKKVIEATLEVGHASMHRNYAPSREDLIHVLDMTENLIQYIYVCGVQADRLKKKIPPRSKKP